MEPIRLLIVDDHQLFREGVQAILAGVEGLEVLGEAQEGEKALSLCRQLQPDVVLMDLVMPGMGGLEATRRILHESPHIGIIVLTMYEDPDSVFQAMRSGARGYLLKGANKAELLRAIQAVAEGEALFAPAVAERILGFFSALPLSPRPLIFPELSEREREVLSLIAQGLSNAEIARRLELRIKTVRNHGSNIFSKLMVASRAEAIVKAREAGLGQRD